MICTLPEPDNFNIILSMIHDKYCRLYNCSCLLMETKSLLSFKSILFKKDYKES